MAKITSQVDLDSGLSVIDEELAPSSAGGVSKTGMHIPDTKLIDAVNTLPTLSGYTSFFGTADTLEVTPLSSSVIVQEMLVFKTLHGATIQLAFCTDGLYLRSVAGDAVAVRTVVPINDPNPAHITFDLPAGKGAWILVVPTIALSSWKMWTYTLMNNKLYVYQKGLGYIGAITSYTANQVVFEQLPPSYINTDLTRHVFTFTSEDDSNGDDTYKSIRFTTDTGLDFGLQKILVDSPTDVSSGILSWENAFILSNFFAFTVISDVSSGWTNPVTEYIGTDQVGGGGNPAIAHLEQAVLNTTHDGTATDLTLTFRNIPDFLAPTGVGVDMEGLAEAEGLTWIGYNGNYLAIFPTDTFTDVKDKLVALYLLDPILASINVGYFSLEAGIQYTRQYTFTVAFTLLDPTAIVTATLDQDGTTLFTEDSHTTELIPMGHIEGIMSGKSRLAAWDVDNLIYSSSAYNLLDFTPSAATGANQVSVPAIQGRIVKCEGFTNGFVIYATGNVIIATFSPAATSIFKFNPVTDAEGLVDFRHIATWKELHYYWSSKGLVIISPSSSKSEFVFPGITDWVKKHRYPIEVSLLAGRFLVLALRDRDSSFSNRAVRIGGTTKTSNPPHISLSPVEFSYASPGLSLGTTKTRSLVFDIQLGKWGTCDIAHKRLISLTPYNQSGFQLSKNYELFSGHLDNEQRELAVLLGDGYTRVCNDSPTDSYVLFGHYAAHRYKMTKLVEVDTEYVDFPDAYLEIEASQDRATIDWSNKLSYAQTSLAASQGLNLAARWFNILISGRYHIKRVLIKGYKYGRK